MKTSLVDRYCHAIEEWANVTGAQQRDLIFWSLAHSGGFWFQEAQTMDALKNHLTFLTGEVRIPESTLIPGLVRAVEVELVSMAEGKAEGNENLRRTIKGMRQVAEHPEEHQDMVARLSAAAQREGGEQFSPTKMLEAADRLADMLDSHEQDRVKAAKQFEEWQRVTAPFLTQEALHGWFSSYLDDIVFKR